MPVAREGLERSVPFQIERADSTDSGDGLTLSGHAAVFNQETEIDSWEGRFKEIISPGAFKKTIRERTPVMQFDHGRHPLIGSIPIGTIESLSEDDSGLFVEGRMADNWLMEPVRDAIANKTVNGMSFRFEIVKDEWRDDTGKIYRDPDEIMRLLWNPGDVGVLTRTLKELKVAELGPVVFPAYAGTDVSVRSNEIATLVMSSEDLIHEVRSALARDTLPKPKPGLEDIGSDLVLRKNVARAILFGNEPHKEMHSLSRSTLATIMETKVEEIEPLLADTRNVVEEEPLLNKHSEEIASPSLRDELMYGLRSITRTINSVEEKKYGSS